MKSRSSHASTPTPAPIMQTSPLSGFKFSTIGQNVTLLDRMGENVHVTPSPEQELSQDRTSSSLSLSRRGLSRSLATGTPVERPSPTNSNLGQHQSNALGSAHMSSTPSESHDVRFPHFHDQRRTPAIPELQYPIAAPDNDGSPLGVEQSTPMDQDSPPLHQTSMPRNSAVASVPGSCNGVMDRSVSPSTSTLPQRSRSLAPSESEQLRRPVEQLIKLASVREERMSRQREIFDQRSGELSTYSSDASRASKAVQDQIELIKLQAEEMRAQAGRMLQEASKTRELADRLITSVDTLNADAPNATKRVDLLVERSEQMTSFTRKNFDWLTTLREREQEKVDVIQIELSEQALAEINRLARMQELQRQSERQKAEAEAQEQAKAARREEEEREAAKKRAEEEEEAARKKSYEAQRAAVMEEKRRFNEAQAKLIQDERERERKLVDDSGSGSNASPTVSPGTATEHLNNAQVSTSLFTPPVVPGPSRSPARGKGLPDVTATLSQPPSSPNKARIAPASVWFVPAQTEVGRTVNTDSPLSSTTLASELHPRIAETSQRPLSNHSKHAPAQDQMLRQGPRLMTPTLEQRRVEIKREPSVEVLPSTRSRTSPSRPSTSAADMDDGRQRHLAIPLRTTSQDRDGDQRNMASSASRADPPYVAQNEENRRRSDPSAPVLLEQASLVHSRDSLHGHAAQGTDVRRHARRDSSSSDRSTSRWNDRDRRSRSPVPRRPLSRSPSPYTRKRFRSGSPPYDARQGPDYWKSPRSNWRSRSDWAPNVADRDRGRDRDRQSYDYDRERQGDSPRRYRAAQPRRIDTYRPTHSPAPPSPRQYRQSPRPGYRDRSPSPEYETRRFVGPDVQDRESERINTNARHHEANHEADARRPVEREEQQRWQRPTPSPSDRDRTPTPPPRLAEAEVGLLDRIDMNATEDRGRGRGRPLHGATRGGANSRRGLRGGLSRGRGVVSGPTPALLTRMTGTTTRGTRPAHAPSLSDRMQQD